MPVLPISGHGFYKVMQKSGRVASSKPGIEPATSELEQFQLERTWFNDHQSELRADLEKNRKRHRDIVQFLVTWGEHHPKSFVTVTMKEKLRNQASQNFRLEDHLADFESLLQQFEEWLGVLECLGDQMKNSS